MKIREDIEKEHRLPVAKKMIRLTERPITPDQYDEIQRLWPAIEIINSRASYHKENLKYQLPFGAGVLELDEKILDRCRQGLVGDLGKNSSLLDFLMMQEGGKHEVVIVVPIYKTVKIGPLSEDTVERFAGYQRLTASREINVIDVNTPEDVALSERTDMQMKDLQYSIEEQEDREANPELYHD